MAERLSLCRGAAVPIDAGTMAVMTKGGVLSFVAKPVAAPQGE